ncbi:MAG TPA: Rid family hydrolase [Patescibacteria group bacterium]|nr:Rid family hydrolase [Patescibacteria group bacterium]
MSADGPRMQAEPRQRHQSARAVGATLGEIWIAARPAPEESDFADQMRGAYDALRRALEGQGADPRDVVAERLFYSDITTQIDEATAIRAAFYRDAGASRPPVASQVEQPPAGGSQKIEIQAWAVTAGTAGAPAVRPLAALTGGVSGASVEAGGARRVLIAGVTGGEPDDELGFAPQAERMFARGEACLRGAGLTFRRVARTWIFLDDIDRDYAALNRARHDFFEVHGVTPAPASTGIRGRPHRLGRLCSLDLVAHDEGARTVLRPFNAETMNEAASYGSDFSRGMRVDLPDRTLLHVSGTASIDAGGSVVHPGNPAAQAARMLLNVRRLLESQGAGLEQVVSAVTYLKSGADRADLLRACREAGLPDRTPHTVCIADVCRPEWLCEMEAMAVLV